MWNNGQGHIIPSANREGVGCTDSLIHLLTTGNSLLMKESVEPFTLLLTAATLNEVRVDDPSISGAV